MQKNKPLIIFTFILVLFIVSIIPACSKKGNETVEFQAFHHLSWHLETENKFFQPVPHCRNYYFYRGWRRGKNEAVSPQAVIRFFHLSPRDRELHFTIEYPRFASKEQVKPLLIDLLLGGELLQQLEINDKEKTFTIRLPQQLLKIGENFLSFNVPDFQPPAEEKIFKSKYKSIYKIKNIFFKDTVTYEPVAIARRNNQDQDKSILFQPAGSRFKIAVDPKVSKKLEYSFVVQSFGKAGGQLLIHKFSETGTRAQLTTIPLTQDTTVTGSLVWAELGIKEKTILDFEYLHPFGKSFLDWQNCALELTERRDGKSKQQQQKGQLAGTHPHIFFIVIDATRFDRVNKDLGGKSSTPHIQEFSASSYEFTRMFANAPYTGGSTATMLSGFLPEVHGVQNNINQLPKEITTLPLYLREAGYRTHGITANLILPRTNLLRDFDQVIAARDFGDRRYLGTSYVDIQRIIEAIKNAQYDHPQFFYFHLLPPHAPYTPGSAIEAVAKQKIVTPLQKKYNSDFKHVSRKMNIAEKYHLHLPGFTSYLEAGYRDNLIYADQLVGAILQSLKEKKLFDQSLVIVTSDHGEAFFEHGKYTHNTTNYMEMLHVPFFLKLPGQKERMTVKDDHSLVDLLPTFVQLLDLEKLPDWQGRALSLDKDEVNPADRPSQQGYSIYSKAGDPDLNIAIMYGKYKYIFNCGREELYDLEKDPLEKNDLAGQQLYLRLYLKQILLNKLFENERLHNKLGVQEIPQEKRPQEVIDELKSLGYL